MGSILLQAAYIYDALMRGLYAGWEVPTDTADIYIYSATDVHTLRTNVCMCACIRVRMYVSMYVCMYVGVYVCIYVRIYVCMYVGMYVCMYVCMYVRVDGI